MESSVSFLAALTYIVISRGPTTAHQLSLLCRAVLPLGLRLLLHRRHGAHAGLLLRQLSQELGGFLLPLQLQRLLLSNLQ